MTLFLTNTSVFSTPHYKISINVWGEIKNTGQFKEQIILIKKKAFWYAK